MSQDRKQLIRLAAKRPVGDPVRRVLLGELQKESAQVIDPADEDQVRSIAQDIKGMSNSWVKVEVNNWAVRFEFYLASPVQVSIDPKGVSIYVRNLQLPTSGAPVVDVGDYLRWVDEQNSAAIRLGRIQKSLRGAKTIKNSPDDYYEFRV